MVKNLSDKQLGLNDIGKKSNCDFFDRYCDFDLIRDYIFKLKNIHKSQASAQNLLCNLKAMEHGVQCCILLTVQPK